MDVAEAVEELRKSSLVDTAKSPDKSRFLSVPLVAAEFGKRKLAASPSKSAVESDLEMLRNFGPGQKTTWCMVLRPGFRDFSARSITRLGDGQRNYRDIYRSWNSSPSNIPRRGLISPIFTSAQAFLIGQKMP